jgi:bifunctional DNA-binding transcriptional regulator/antitoxin component of YhaV-PrlF toxin-antitoxin module
MGTLTVTAKGQITLRREFLEHLGIQPGQKLTVEKLPNRGLAVRGLPKTGSISDVFGIFERESGPTLTIEDMNDIIANAAAGKR